MPRLLYATTKELNDLLKKLDDICSDIGSIVYSSYGLRGDIPVLTPQGRSMLTRKAEHLVGIAETDYRMEEWEPIWAAE